MAITVMEVFEVIDVIAVMEVFEVIDVIAVMEVFEVMEVKLSKRMTERYLR